MSDAEFKELHDEVITGYKRPFTAQDVEFLRASIKGCEFEPETLDQMRYMRLYYMGYVAIYQPNEDDWPIAIITMHGAQMLEAIASFTPATKGDGHA